MLVHRYTTFAVLLHPCSTEECGNIEIWNTEITSWKLGIHELFGADVIGGKSSYNLTQKEEETLRC